MIESFLSFICEHAHHAHWIIFLLLLLAGLSIPISADVLILSGGAIASTCLRGHTFQLFTWILIGCYLAAWEAYWMGRLLGPKLYRFRLFSHVITPQRLDLLRHYYAKFGVWTFIIGRFIPGGVRNALFMSSGLMKMPFHLFVLRDGLAALLSVSFLFYLGYLFGTHIDTVIYYFQRYSEVAVLIIGLIIVVFLYRLYRQKR